MDERFFEDVKRYVGFGEADARALVELRPLLAKSAQPVIDTFYERILEHPRAGHAITGGQPQVERLKVTLQRWLVELGDGTYGRDYFERRAAIGRRHVLIELPQVFMVTAMDVIRRELSAAIRIAYVANEAQREVVLEAVHKILDIDLAIMLETYQEDSFAKVARAERKASDARYSILIERAPLGIALVREGKYLFANESYARIYGLASHTVLLGAPVESVYHPDEQARVRERWRDDASWRETYTVADSRRADGRRIDVSVIRAPLELDGKRAVQLIVRDVTEETRLANELEEARAQVEEKRRLAALGEMVAGIAHEIRNPLQGVGWGVIELKELCKAPGAPEGAKDALTKIERSTAEIEAIVAQVLDFARPLKADRIPFLTSDIFEATCDDMKALAAANKVLLACETKDGPDEVLVDAMKLKQALVNLVRNAIEASPPGGRVILRAAGGPGAGAPVVFEVQDEGTGIREDLRDRVYLPFVTTKVKGTGLGLAITRRIVEVHGGTIALEPVKPRGTIARITLSAAVRIVR
ncbi:MAG: protoglobin domain-containing protein [Planctomycetota bacterium]